MSESLMVHLTKEVLDAVLKLIKARVRVHHCTQFDPNISVIYAANHFTSLETVLLPCLLYKNLHAEPFIMASKALFRGETEPHLLAETDASFLSLERDVAIVRSLLLGKNPWLLFPEKRLEHENRDDSAGILAVGRGGGNGRSLLNEFILSSLHAAFYRILLHRYRETGDTEKIHRILERYALNELQEITRGTAIIPVNITYYPIHVRETLANKILKASSNESPERMLKELLPERTVFAEDTDIDVNFGSPIMVDELLRESDFEPAATKEKMEFKSVESDLFPLWERTVRILHEQCIAAVDSLTTINMDHIFAMVVSCQPEGRCFCDRDYRERMYMCIQQVLLHGGNVHPEVKRQEEMLLNEEGAPVFHGFLDRCVQQGVLERCPSGYRRGGTPLVPETMNQGTMSESAFTVFQRELESAGTMQTHMRHIVRAPGFLVKSALRTALIRRDMRDFEEQYAKYYDPEQSKPPWVGQPFLLRPWRIRGGVVLSHGYMSAPLEVRALAEYLYRHGFAVYGVRLTGHGTAPEDLAKRQWEEWYDSLNRGYAILRTMTDAVFLGGFSTGGCLALLGAARKANTIQGVFSICAPLYVRDYSIRLVPSIISLNTLLKRIGQSQYAWDYVVNNPENKHINYMRNPLTGVQQLTYVMNATAETLEQVKVPALVIQASKDTTVDPASGPTIFEKIGGRSKRLVLFERERHGIINGEGSPEIFAQVEQFLSYTLKQERSHRFWLLGRKMAELFSRTKAAFIPKSGDSSEAVKAESVIPENGANAQSEEAEIH